MTDIVERLRDQGKDAFAKQYSLGMYKLCDEAAAEIERLRSDAADLQQTFDLQWEADMRAVKRWREAHPGNDLVLPDRASMVVWLLEQHDARAQRAPIQSETELVKTEIARAQEQDAAISASEAEFMDELRRRNAQRAPTITDEMVNAAAREVWNDRDARHGGAWDTRDPREVCVIQTKATARAALKAALTSTECGSGK